MIMSKRPQPQWRDECCSKVSNAACSTDRPMTLRMSGTFVFACFATSFDAWEYPKNAEPVLTGLFVKKRKGENKSRRRILGEDLFLPR